MIKEYNFGKIVIDSKTYHRDIIVCGDKIQDNWWRKTGHELCVADIEGAIDEFKPTVVVVGTGRWGMMKVLSETDSFLKSCQIRLIVQNTTQACDTYNELLSAEKVMGAFHLTC